MKKIQNIYRQLYKTNKDRTKSLAMIQCFSNTDERILDEYAKQIEYVRNYDQILESYNINQVRDQQREVRSVSQKVGLGMPKLYQEK